MEEKNLFLNDFPPISDDQWEKQIIKDLKGADYKRKLIWKTGQGFDVKPYYRKSDLKKLQLPLIFPGEYPYLRGNKNKDNSWHIRQDIRVDDVKKTNKKALDILMKGVNSIGFIFDDNYKPSIEDIETLTENIYADAVELNFISNVHHLDFIRIIDQLTKKYNRKLEEVVGSLSYDPFGKAITSGYLEGSGEVFFNQAKAIIQHCQCLPKYKIIDVNGCLYRNSGALVMEELAFCLAQGEAYLTQLTDRGLSIDEVAPRLKFNFGIGSSYFMEIAKLRAARTLWAQIVKAYGPSDDHISKMNIHCSNISWNKTLFDPHVNLLRTTTESMSAIIGGTDSLCVLPYTTASGDSTELADRLARNQQLLLKEESYLDKVVDVASGSYYIESLTDNILEKAWEMFMNIQEKGGFIEAIKSGFLQQKINASRQEKQSELATRKEILLGVNQYPDLSVKQLFVQSGTDENPHSAIKNIETISPERAALTFEKLRLETVRFSEKYKTPAVFLLPAGNAAMRRARAQFALNFFGCAGFDILDHNGFDTVEEAVSEFRRSNAEVVVICSSDQEYSSLVPEICKHLKKEAILVIAGYPKEQIDDFREMGIQHFIQIKSNLLETLMEIQKKLITQISNQ
jgi:methylmalonyl-CoA mutase